MEGTCAVRVAMMLAGPVNRCCAWMISMRCARITFARNAAMLRYRRSFLKKLRTNGIGGAQAGNSIG